MRARPTQPQWLRVQQAADLLGVSSTTVRRWVESGRLVCQRTPSGQRRFLRDNLERILGEAAAPAGDRLVAGDHAEERYRALVESSDDHIFIVGRDHRLQYVNAAAARLFGRPPDEMVGKALQELFPADSATHQETMVRRVFETGETVRRQARIVFPQGELWLDVSLVPLKNELSEVTAVAGINRDITRQKLAESSLRASEERYRVLAETSPDMIFIIDRDDSVQYVNAAAAAGLGQRAEKVVGKPRRELFEPEAAEAQGAALRHVFETGEPLVSQVDRLFPQGEVWLDSSLVPISNEAGEVMAVFGVSRDVTDVKRTHDALSAAEERYRTLFEQIPDGVYVFDEGLRVRECNQRMAALMECAPAELVGKSAEEVGASREAREALERALAGKVARWEATHVGKSSGRARFLSGMAAPLHGANDEIAGVVAVVSDLTERKQLEDQLRYLTRHDELTGIYNRRYFEDETRRLASQEMPRLGLIVCDVDDFKLVNDSRGHALGDQLLIDTAELLRGCLRSGDFVARIGGDEFALLLPQADAAAVAKVCRRISDAVAGREARDGVPLALSVGAAALGERCPSIAELFREADADMYKEKRRRRSRSARSGGGAGRP